MSLMHGVLGAALFVPIAAGSAPPERAANTAQVSAPAAVDAADSYYHFVLGRHLESLGEIDRAIAEHREALRHAPRPAEIHAEIASVYARQGRVEEALAAAREALALAPASIEANRVMGGILAATAEGANGRSATIDEAIKYLERGRRGDGIDADSSMELTLARLYVRSGRHDKALSVLESLVEVDPLPEAFLLMAQAHTAQNRPDAAAQALEAGSAFNPRLLVSLGELYERQQRWDRAAQAYERALDGGGDSAEISMRWAGALLNQPGREPARKALSLLEPVAAQRPADERTLYLVAQAQRKAGDLTDAEATARRLVGLDPVGFWGAYALTQVLEDRGNYRGVVDVLSPIVEAQSPGEPLPDRQELTLLTHLGFAYLQVGQAGDAARVFERGRRKGANGAFDLYLVQAYLAGRDYQRALEVVQPLRAREPRDLRLVQYEARALAGLQRVDQAAELLRAAVEQQPGERGPYLTLADVLAGAGRHAEARRTLDAAATRFPADLGIPFQQGAISERAGDHASAEASFRRVISRDPKHAPSLNYLGYMLAEQGERLDEAVDLITRALAVDPDNGAYLDSLGWAYFKQGRLAEAQEHLARAASKLPSTSVIQDHLGDVLAALGRPADAISAWQRALEGDRDGIDGPQIERKIATARAKGAR